MSIEQERRRAGIALWVLVHTRAHANAHSHSCISRGHAAAGQPGNAFPTSLLVLAMGDVERGIALRIPSHSHAHAHVRANLHTYIS